MRRLCGRLFVYDSNLKLYDVLLIIEIILVFFVSISICCLSYEG